jgi:GT2 family glycosyltransferase
MLFAQKSCPIAAFQNTLSFATTFQQRRYCWELPQIFMQTISAPAIAIEPSVAIVVLNWNDPAPTFDCLDALRRLDYGNARFVVVDNGSRPETLRPLTALTDIELLKNPTNLGFAGGANVGLRHAFSTGADYVWLVNADALPAPGALKALVAMAEAEPTIGLLSPLLHDHGNLQKPNACFGFFDRRSLGTTQTDDPEQARRWLAECPGSVIAFGTALVIRRRLFEAIGGFDESLFAYAEDVDYCLRCVRAGFRVSFCFDAVVWHSFRDPVGDPEGCPPHIHYYMTRNYPLLWRKLSTHSLPLARAAYWLLRRRLLVIERLSANQTAAEAVLAGLWDGFIGRGGVYDPTRRAPWWLRKSLGRHPGAIIRLMDGKLRIGGRGQ